jgi:hypothetical protein
MYAYGDSHTQTHTPKGRRNQGRPLKRLPGVGVSQSHDDDDDDDTYMHVNIYINTHKFYIQSNKLGLSTYVSAY